MWFGVVILCVNVGFGYDIFMGLVRLCGKSYNVIKMLDFLCLEDEMGLNWCVCLNFVRCFGVLDKFG